MNVFVFFKKRKKTVYKEIFLNILTVKMFIGKKIITNFENSVN